MGETIMTWRDYILTLCILFACLFHAGNGVEGGVNRRSVLEDDAELILSLSERLYSEVDSDIDAGDGANVDAEKRRVMEAVDEDVDENVENGASVDAEKRLAM